MDHFNCFDPSFIPNIKGNTGNILYMYPKRKLLLLLFLVKLCKPEQIMLGLVDGSCRVFSGLVVYVF